MRLQFMPVTDLSRVCKELKITFTFYLIFGSLYGFPFYKNFDTLLCTVSFNWLSKLRAAQTLKRALKTQCRRMFGITHPSSFGFKNKFFFLSWDDAHPDATRYARLKEIYILQTLQFLQWRSFFNESLITLESFLSSNSINAFLPRSCVALRQSTIWHKLVLSHTCEQSIRYPKC